MFGDLFTYEECITTENRIIYTDVVILKDDNLRWARSSNSDVEIEAVFDFVNGILYFGEYDTDTQVYNKSPNYQVKIF